ncbi:uncharacterized protein LOC120295576 [Eucalyptus grandis]|uniref:uncharacterized protein LOC120295576 n=1 Tax=Eucalyptus grandis TaxID=71139 RepID=UPI00192EF0A8|nr:uncharacterized protein LOC120295576 [Eucalyptus grandis]XP_039172752.1 uncharacterized protein LOC120295576 [Eucalyptus grandis]
MSLKSLEFPSHLLWTAPNLPYLTNLLDLDICEGTPRLSEFGQGALEMDWVKGITFLERLTLALEDVTFPPVNLATLTQLRQLHITCFDPQSLIGLPSSLETLSLSYVKLPIERSLLSNLTNLSHLSLHRSQRRVVEFDSLLGQHREKLDHLQLGKGELPARLSVSGLKGLQELYVYACPNVVEVHGVEKLELRKSLHISSSSSFETLPDLSELKKLQIVGLTFCPPQNLPDLRLPDTCYMTVVGCGNLRAFKGYYSEWKDRQSVRTVDDVNSERWMG